MIANILPRHFTALQLQYSFLLILKAIWTKPYPFINALLLRLFRVHMNTKGNFKKFIIGSLGIPIFIAEQLLFEFLFNINQRLIFNLCLQQAFREGVHLHVNLSDCVSSSGILYHAKSGFHQFFGGVKRREGKSYFLEHWVVSLKESNVDVTGTGKRSLTGSGGQQGSAALEPSSGD